MAEEEDTEQTFKNYYFYGNVDGLPTENFEELYIESAQQNGANIRQAFRSYLREYFKNPPTEYTDKDISHADFLDHVLIPRFEKEWLKCKEERERDWKECSNCGDTLPPHCFQRYSVEIKNVTDICLRCEQYMGHFNSFKSKK